MDSYPSDWLPGSFSRSPAWRTLRAAYRHTERLGPDPRIDDEWVEIALRLNRAPGAPDLPATVRAAFEVWTADQLPRALLEAQLLTGRTFTEVGAACGFSEPVVHAYHQLYFDVRPSADARDWVLTRAVRSTPMNEFAGPQPAGVWKYLAFFGGELVLDLIVAVTLERPLPARLRETFGANPELEDRRVRLKAKLLVAALTARSAQQLGSVVELAGELRALDEAAGRTVGKVDPLLPVLGAFLSALGGPTLAAPQARARSPRIPQTRRGRSPSRTHVDANKGDARAE